MSVTVEYVRGAEDPPLARLWLDSGGSGVDLSVYATLTLRMQHDTDPPIEKAGGVTGDAAGNLTITWAVADLDIPTGVYRSQVWATDGADRDRVMDDLHIRIVAAVPTPAP